MPGQPEDAEAGSISRLCSLSLWDSCRSSPPVIIAETETSEKTEAPSITPPASDDVVSRQSPPRPDGAGAASPPGPAPARLLAQLRQQAERLLSADRWEAAALVLGEALSTLAESSQLLDESGELRAQLLTLRAEAVTKHVRSEAERVGGARSGPTEECAFFMRLGEALEHAECISEAAAAFEKAGLLGQNEASARASARALRLRAWKA